MASQPCVLIIATHWSTFTHTHQVLAFSVILMHFISHEVMISNDLVQVYVLYQRAPAP